jgi:hypothetical protein
MDGWSEEGCGKAKTMDRDGWRLVIESAKTLHGL